MNRFCALLAALSFHGFEVSEVGASFVRDHVVADANVKVIDRHHACCGKACHTLPVNNFGASKTPFAAATAIRGPTFRQPTCKTRTRATKHKRRRYS